MQETEKEQPCKAGASEEENDKGKLHAAAAQHDFQGQVTCFNRPAKNPCGNRRDFWQGNAKLAKLAFSLFRRGVVEPPGMQTIHPWRC